MGKLICSEFNVFLGLWVILWSTLLSSSICTKFELEFPRVYKFMFFLSCFIASYEVITSLNFASAASATKRKLLSNQPNTIILLWFDTFCSYSILHLILYSCSYFIKSNFEIHFFQGYVRLPNARQFITSVNLVLVRMELLCLRPKCRLKDKMGFPHYVTKDCKSH